MDIIESECRFLKSKGSEDLLFDHLELTSLEKNHLVQQIQALEEKIALGKKF